MKRRILIAAALLVLPVGLRLTAAEPQPNAVRAEVARLVGQLDDDNFSNRRRAAARLSELCDQAELGSLLSAELRPLLVSPATSFEVRAQLLELVKRLPLPDAAAAQIKPADLKDIFDKFSSDTFAEREAAEQKFEQILADSTLTCPAVVELKRRLNDPKMTPIARRQLEPLWEKLREAWIMRDECKCELPPVSDAQIERWVEQLKSPTPPESPPGMTYAAVERELVDLLLQKGYADKVRPIIDGAMLAADLDPLAESRLRTVSQWLEPAMVAEIWRSQEHVTMQFLLIDVPQFPEGGTQATHFDRIDDDTAHCVSGNSLVPGDYPVRQAIPDPQGRGIMFHLIPLPTPLARLKYNYGVKRDPQLRLAELSQRTLDRILADKRQLGELDLLMLEQLESQVVSKFAGPYFLAVDDRPLTQLVNRIEGRSIHNSLAYTLAMIGTHEAIPGIEQALAKKRIIPPTNDNPWSMAHIAMLTIARRDPWKEVDAWLAAAVAREIPLVANLDPSPDFGATAAAILLARHEVATKDYNLEPANDIIFERLGLPGYRFSDPSGRREVLRWWKSFQNAAAQRESS